METSTFDRLINEALKDTDVPGGVWGAVAPSGEPHIAATGFPTDTIFRIASLTKPIVAALTLILADRGRFTVDDPIRRWLPEIADRSVLVRPDADLVDTVPAHRELTIRDLLTMGMGFGYDPRLPEDAPIMQAIQAGRLGPGAVAPPMSGSAWLTAVGQLPMMHQPGEGWLYDSSYLALGLLLERAGGADLDTLAREAIFDPLGMTDTGWWVREDGVQRVPAFVETAPSGSGLVETLPAADPALRTPPPLRGGTTGLCSTVHDLLAFGRLLLNDGFGSDGRLLPEGAVAAMMTDQRSPGQVAMSELFLGPGWGWGFGGGIHPDGAFGWSGGTGTHLQITAGREACGILLTQRGLDSPGAIALTETFFRAARGLAD